MKKQLSLPLCAIVLGAAGFALRLRELTTAFEPNGLPIQGAPVTLALIALTAALLLFSGGLSWRLCRGCAPLSYDEAFRCGHSGYITATVISAALLAGGGALGIWRYISHETTQLSYLLLAVLVIVSGGCILITGRNNYRGEEKGKFFGPLLVPAFTGCLWLIAAYQSRAADPVILDYVYHLLAIISILLSFYFMAGFSFEKGRPGLTLFSSLLAIYFSCVTLADRHDMMSRLLFAFAIVYFTAHSVVLLNNLKREEPNHE